MTPSDRSILWELCFGDAPDVAESFLGIDDVITLEERADGKLIGMASLVPIITDGALCGFYAYGVCTHPDHRGRGVFKRIMEKCECEAMARGADFICLIPATDRLANTYSRIGYSKRIALCDAPEIHGDAIRPRSRDFYEFAIPESTDVPLLTVDFGVMKPLTECADKQEFHFASYMGER